jgi:hypothetical protein
MRVHRSHRARLSVFRRPLKHDEDGVHCCSTVPAWMHRPRWFECNIAAATLCWILHCATASVPCICMA